MECAGDNKDVKICGVCGDKALGYNFSAVTCESCKAFFRRNALTKKDFRCPFKEQCEITAVTRRFCQKCRLEKCFAIGMRKDYIMTEEDKLQKRQKIEQNRAKKRSISTKEGNKKIKRDYSSEESIDYICKSEESSPDFENNEDFGVINPTNIVSVIKNSTEFHETYYEDNHNNDVISDNYVEETMTVNDSSMIRTILNPTPNSNTTSGSEENSPLLSSLINNNDVPCNRNNTSYVQSNTDVTRDVLQDVQRLIRIIVLI